MTKASVLGLLMIVGAAFLLPQFAYASVEGTLTAIQTKLVNVILPLAAMLGLVYAGFSFISGSANARAHLMLAILGCIIGFGAQSIVAFIRGLVN